MSLEEFLASRPYVPDPFQTEAARSVAEGHSVVVTAPTGAGKTLIAEAAIHLARERGRRAFYTTPIKALSNQKYGDLTAEHGPAAVGLLTGDNVVNGGAPIVVMTTEVLRNMIYADPRSLDSVDVVILDEVHYLQDPFRGAVWEEVIIHAPPHVRLVCLSATIANAEEFAAWVRERRGTTDLVVATERPVPLRGMYLVRDRYGDEPVKLFSTFVEREGRRRPNPRLEHLLGMERGRRGRLSTPRRLEVVEKLAEEAMLPAIYFIFSRAGCDAAALRILESGLRLTSPDERRRIREIAESRTGHLTDSDLAALDYGRWLTTLEVGVGAHHAGMVPAFKEAVEELFAVGLLKVVFATETLALGINMPARSVVLEGLSKFTGETHELLEPGDYTQLTGRAGRRGIDDVGYGVVLHSRYVRFDLVARIASAGSHPLRSSFRPTYNMAANLVANYPRRVAMELLTASYAQFQHQDRRAAGQEQIALLEARLAEEMAKATCERGSVEEYVGTLDGGGDAGARSELAGTLRPGDVVDIPGGSREGRYVVLRRLARGERGLRLLVMATSGRTSTIGFRELVAGSKRVATIDLPGPYRHRDRKYQQTLLRGLRRIPTGVSSRHRQRDGRSPTHPVAECPDVDRHVRWFRRAGRTRRRIGQLENELRHQGVGLLEAFAGISAVLESWGYLDGWRLTARGDRLRFIYNELDLLLAEAVERGLFSDLGPTELVALASCFVYEARTEASGAPAWPGILLARRYETVTGLWDDLCRSERTNRLPLTRRPDPGFVEAAYAWAAGRELDEVPVGHLAPGDFVRVSRQLVDLLRQLRDTFPELGEVVRASLRAVDRGVVAAQGVG